MLKPHRLGRDDPAQFVTGKRDDFGRFHHSLDHGRLAAHRAMIRRADLPLVKRADLQRAKEQCQQQAKLMKRVEERGHGAGHSRNAPRSRQPHLRRRRAGARDRYTS